MFGSFKLLAGDFDIKNKGMFTSGSFILPIEGSWKGEKYESKDVETVEIATEEKTKKMAGAIGWGIVGGIATGGIGALAGILAGGNKKTVVFIVHLKNGKKFMGETDAKHYQTISAACF